LLERQGLTEEAVEMYLEALALDPDSAAAHYNLAGTLARAGAFDEAESHFRAALAQQPNSQTHTGLGYVLWQQGREDEAIASLNAAIDADPTNAAAYDQLGTIRLQQGELEEAAATSRRLLEHRPSPAAHRELAQVLTRLGKEDEARREMELATASERSVVEKR
jgi:tetratricopeptide (TPR) repeat protein